MKPGWTAKKLGDLYDIGSAKRVHKKDWKSEGVPFYRAREIVKLARNGSVDNELFISEEQFAEYKALKGAPATGDLMVTGVGTLGICYLVKEHDRFYFKDASVLWFRPKREVEARFIEYAFQTPQLISQSNDGSGATVGTLTIGRAQDLALALPPLEEQRRIVAVLDKAFEGLDRARENTEANLASAKELFELKRDQSTTIFNSVVETTTVGEICSTLEYGTSSKSSPEGEVPVLRMGNLQDGEIDWSNLKYSNDPADIQQYSLSEGDVLFNRTNSMEHVGKTSIYRGCRQAIFAGYLVRVNYDRSRVCGEFLNFYLNSKLARDYGRSVMGKSVNQANISAGKLKNYPISYPSLEEQKAISSSLLALRANVSETLKHYRKKIEELSELRQSILQRAFAGELT